MKTSMGSKVASISTESSAENAKRNARCGDGQPPIHVHVYGVRVLVLTTVVIASLAIVINILIKGQVLKTLNAKGLTDIAKRNLLDQYNSYSGSLVSVVQIPLSKFLDVLLPIFFLCFATNTVLNEDTASFRQKVGLKVSTLGVSWLIGQGISSLNVQFDSPKVEYIITQSDFTSSNIGANISFEVSSITNSTHIAGIPSTETMLRSAISPMSAKTGTTCGFSIGPASPNAQASVQFGFALNSWLKYMLPESITSTESFTFTMEDTFTANSLNKSVLPGGDLQKTASLFSYSIWMLWRHFGSTYPYNVDPPWFGPVDFYNRTMTLDPATMLTNMQKLITNATGALDNVHDPNWLGAWYGVSNSEIKVELANFDISPQIKFETVTFDLPVGKETMAEWMLNIQNWGVLLSQDGEDDYYSLATTRNCNDNGCLLPTPSKDGIYQDQIRMLRLCMTGPNSTDEYIEAVATITSQTLCQYPSNSSVLIYSLARNTDVEAVWHPEEEDEVLPVETADLYTSTYSWYLKNPRTSYKVTVGRLSWETRDLSDPYGAKCGPGVNCQGLAFPLSNGNQHVILNEAQLPKPQKVGYPVEYTSWQALALTSTAVDTTYQASPFYPPNYPFMNGSTKWEPLNGSRCSSMASDFVNDIFQRHIYSRDPVQPAYTAAMFWLFQNAAVKDVDTTAVPPNKSVRLDFDGNQISISLHVSMPSTSALLSLAGCACVFVFAIYIMGWAYKDRQSSKLTDQLTAQNVAGMLVGARQYSSLVMQINAQRNHLNEDLRSIDRIKEYSIEQIVLRHRADPSKTKLTIGINEATANTNGSQDRKPSLICPVADAESREKGVSKS